jgi:hypothetical protein
MVLQKQLLSSQDSAIRNRWLIHAYYDFRDEMLILAIYAPMIDTAPCVLFLMVQIHWHSPIGSMPFQRAQKILYFLGPTLSHLPK